MQKLFVDHVGIRYSQRRGHKGHQAVGDATFEVPAGSFVSLIGRSGCGKSSLLRAIAGLLPCATGQVLMDGVPVQGPGEGGAVVFQSPRLLPWRTVERNVSFGLEVRGDKKEQTRRRTAEAIELVGLKGFEKSYPNTLSGGMQQRANLARALALDPQLLLLDEPFSALDAQTREIMGTELLRIWAATRKTALFVTHQIDEAVFLSDQVVVLSAGPASVVSTVLKIELPRPRTMEMRESQQFARYVHELRALVFEDRPLTHS